MGEIAVGRASDLGVDRHAIQAFYREHWTRKIALSDNRFYTWQFIENPSNAGEDECVVATRNGELSGVMGVNSRPFTMGGQSLRGAELTTWVVSPACRGLGIGPAILDHLTSQYQALIGTGITAEALPIYLRSGFRFIKHIPRFVRLLDLPAIETYAHVEPLGKKLARMRRQQVVATACAVTALSDADIEDIHAEFARTHDFFDRRTAFFRWRYDGHPIFRFDARCLTDQQGRKIAVVTRTNPLPNGASILRVLDIYGHAEMYGAAIAFVDQCADQQGCAAADFFCTAADINSQLIAAGWFSTLDESFFQFPHLFSPLELRMPPTTSLIVWSSHDLRRMVDVSSFYITKQDADLDRPTLEDFAAP
jgi:hypothetical protein